MSAYYHAVDTCHSADYKINFAPTEFGLFGMGYSASTMLLFSYSTFMGEGY